MKDDKTYKFANNTYKNRLRANLCVHCGKVPPMVNGRRCLACTEKNAARELSYYYNRKAAKAAYGG